MAGECLAQIGSMKTVAASGYPPQSAKHRSGKEPKKTAGFVVALGGNDVYSDHARTGGCRGATGSSIRASASPGSGSRSAGPCVFRRATPIWSGPLGLTVGGSRIDHGAGLSKEGSPWPTSLTAMAINVPKQILLPNTSMSGASPERRIISLGNNLAVPQVLFPPSPYRGSFVGLLRPRQFDGKGRGDGMKRGKRVCLPCPQRPLTDRMRRGSSARVGTLVAAGGRRSTCGGIRHIVLRHAFDAQRRRRINGRRALELRGIDGAQGERRYR
jgi:hypothetical protein